MENGKDLAIEKCKADVYSLGVVFYELVDELAINWVTDTLIV